MMMPFQFLRTNNIHSNYEKYIIEHVKKMQYGICINISASRRKILTKYIV